MGDGQGVLPNPQPFVVPRLTLREGRFSLNTVLNDTQENSSLAPCALHCGSESNEQRVGKINDSVLSDASETRSKKKTKEKEMTFHPE